VGDFGLALQAPSGNGCSADIAMIGSDFLADGGGPVSYVRLQTGAAPLPAGTAFVAGDGRVIGIATTNSSAAGALIPSPIAATIVDELIRNSPSPTVAFGFRATDFTAGLSARVGDTRSRGAGVALVQPKSAAARAGLQAGDVIVAVDGSPVSSASELGRALDAAQDSASLDIARADQRLTVNVTRS
jgi:serine protease DegQ